MSKHIIYVYVIISKAISKAILATGEIDVLK